MSILFRQGDIFLDGSQAMVNPVNCFGVMGKGLALKYRENFPKNYKYYRNVCINKMLSPGNCLPFIENKKVIFNFPTKYHWKEKSKFEYIDEGLETLLKLTQVLKISSIAIPALGCGHGGLNWSIVKNLIVEKLTTKFLTVVVYEPEEQ